MPDQPKSPSKLQPSPEDLLRKYEKEQRTSLLQRETELEGTLTPYRVGSVSFLNAVPLTRGIEQEITFATPSKLAEMLRADQLDAALVSITEVLFHDRYDILDGIAVASLGEVKSVILAHRQPLAEIRQIFCDTASLTSVNLLRVLLAEQGIRPEFLPLSNYEAAAENDAFLLIGDRAIDFIRGTHRHQIYDLGAAWYELTNLPFVYAVWAIRRGIDPKPLVSHLRDAKDFGLDTLDYIISSRTEYDHQFRKDYLGWHIHYHLGADEKRGINRFIELLTKHGLGPVFAPRYIS